MTLMMIKARSRFYWQLIWPLAGVGIIGNVVGYSMTYTSISWWVILLVMFCPSIPFLMAVNRVMHYDHMYIKELVKMVGHEIDDNKPKAG